MTVSPALERSSATTLWISAHCSPWAPGGVSQRICQWPATASPAAAAARPASAATPAHLPLAPHRVAPALPRPPVAVRQHEADDEAKRCGEAGCLPEMLKTAH